MEYIQCRCPYCKWRLIDFRLIKLIPVKDGPHQLKIKCNKCGRKVKLKMA